MRIVDIRETAIPIKSDLKNSSIDFSEMTTSVVAVITDVVRDGKKVAGFAFNSTGRYACGAQMRARFIPRILKAKPESLLDATGLLDATPAAHCRIYHRPMFDGLAQLGFDRRRLVHSSPTLF